MVAPVVRIGAASVYEGLAFSRMRERAVLGAITKAVVNAAKLNLLLTVLLTLARIPDPASLGLAAHATPFILASDMLCDLGLAMRWCANPTVRVS
jgi:hypothetical protein